MKSIFLVLIIGLTFSSCEQEAAETPSVISQPSNVTGTLPKATGPIGRVLVSVDDNIWNEGLREVFIKHFAKHAKGPFIGPEPILDFLQQDPSAINSLGLKNRNILKIIYAPESDLTETEIVVKQNYKSQGQVYIIVKDSNIERIKAFFEAELPTYIAVFDSQEDQRLAAKYSFDRLEGFNKVAEEKFGISISVPSSASYETDLDSIIHALDKNSKTLADNPNTGAKGGTYWAKKGIVVWESEYVNEESMTLENILKERDSTLKYAVKGVLENSYMGTEYFETRAPKATEIMVGSANALLIEGLWKHKGNMAASGGGPFLQYAIQHPTRGTVVHALVYIYALNFDKRELIRSAKAILTTISIVD
ncbi:MAG: DUF4837 family protein [Crocinitomicaceae bacterium]